MHTRGQEDLQAFPSFFQTVFAVFLSTQNQLVKLSS